MNIPKNLKSSQIALLKRVLRSREPRLLPLVSRLTDRSLDEDSREAIRAALLAEMCESGLNTDDEPNAYGLKLDEIIGGLYFY